MGFGRRVIQIKSKSKKFDFDITVETLYKELWKSILSEILYSDFQELVETDEFKYNSHNEDYNI